MSIKRVLSPICFYDRAEPALGAAIQFARRLQAELVVVDSWYSPIVAFTESTDWVSPTTIDSLVDDRERELALAVRRCRGAGVAHVSSRLLVGPPSTEVLRLLDREPFDLIVLGMRRLPRHHQVSLGGARRLFHRAPCSVFVASEGDRLERFSNVLCLLDFSNRTPSAIELASDLVEPLGSITLLHVTAHSPFEELSPRAEVVEDERVAFERLQRYADDIRTRRSVHVTILSRIGRPCDEIRDTLRAAGFDLVVMGTHRRTGLRGMLLRSLASEIVRLATCPILFAHPVVERAAKSRAIR